MVADTVLPLTPYPRSPEVIRYSQPTKPPGSGGLMNFACFCAELAQKHAIKNKPAPRMGRVGWG